MANQSYVDTSEGGERNDAPSSIEVWMNENGFKLLNDTYIKLQEGGFETMYGLLLLV